MEKILSLGFIGKYPPAGYRDKIPLRIDNILKDYSELCDVEVITGLYDSLELCAARIALDLREMGHKVFLKIVLTNSEQNHILRNKAKGNPATNAQAIYEKADAVIVMDRSFITIEKQKRLQHIIDSSDILFYCATKGGSDFCLQRGIRSSKINIPSHNLAFDVFGLNSAKIEFCGLSYIWQNKYSVSSNGIPSSYLLLWRCVDPKIYLSLFRVVPDTADYILQTRYLYAENDLPIYIFFLAYTRFLDRNSLLHLKNCWSESWQDFLIFQRILNYILDARFRGRAVPEFDLFDFAQHEELLTQLSSLFSYE